MAEKNIFPVLLPTEPEKNGKYELKIPIYQQDMCTLLRYEMHIHYCFENNHRVRPFVLRKMLELLAKARVDDFEARQCFLVNVKERVTEQLMRADCDFRIENRENDIARIFNFPVTVADREVVKIYTLFEFLANYFDKLVQTEKFKDLMVSKQDFIKYTFSELHGYLRKVPSEKQLSFYQYTVIVGFLAAGFGLLLNEENFQKSPTKHVYYTAFLNNSTSYICKKIKQELDFGLTKETKTS